LLEGRGDHRKRFECLGYAQALVHHSRRPAQQASAVLDEATEAELQVRRRAECSKQPASDLEIEFALCAREPLEIFVRTLPVRLGRNVRFGVLVILSSIRVEHVGPLSLGLSSRCGRHTTRFRDALVSALPSPSGSDDARGDQA